MVKTWEVGLDKMHVQFSIVVIVQWDMSHMNTFSIHQAQMAVFSTSLAQQGGFPASTLTRPPPQWAPLVWSNVCLSWASEIVSCWSLFQPSICPASATLFVSGGRPTSVPSVTPLPSPTPSPQQLTLKLTRSFCKKNLL